MTLTDKVVVHCGGTCEGVWKLGQINRHTGKLHWTQYNTTQQVERAIHTVIARSHEGYCLLSCETKLATTPPPEYYSYDVKESPAIILNLPPFIRTLKSKNTAQSKENLTHSGSPKDLNSTKLNFNIIFIDSVSRHHFYRSLPWTVKAFESINENRNIGRSKDFLLDFELVQAVKSRTFETLQALFSGSIDPYTKSFGVHEMPKNKLKIGSMFKKLKKLDYTTLWLEDLCPYWEWGLSKDLLVYNKTFSQETIWKKMKVQMKKAHIDSLGNTFASCDILSANGFPDPFHGPDKLCYQGNHHHEYQLDYLRKFQMTLQRHSQRFFSFMETNIGHEDYGQRIQYLDSALADYVEFARGLRNTLTVIFSDHGNAYGSYIENSKEGRLETFHPFMFIILPEDVQSLSVFTTFKIDSLIANQNRLVSVLDLHYTLMHLIDQVLPTSEQTGVSNFNQQFNITEFGLFRKVSEHRTCSLIPRIYPNLCICRGYDVSSENPHSDYILAQYFVAMLNSEIQQQRMSEKNGESLNRGENSLGGFGRCHQLKVLKTKNIQKSVITVSIF